MILELLFGGLSVLQVILRDLDLPNSHFDAEDRVVGEGDRKNKKCVAQIYVRPSARAINIARVSSTFGFDFTSAPIYADRDCDEKSA